jgi:serine/threonine protein kinase
MKKNKLFEKNLVSHVLMEKRIMQKIKSNFVTSLESTFEDEIYCYIVMEEAQGGDVYSLTDP